MGMVMLNGLDIFTGIGGITLALSPWVSPVAYCERDPFCQSVILSRMSEGRLPLAPIWDDIQTLRGEMLPSIDILYGGAPCQDFSIAGTQEDVEGARGKLLFEFTRLARELRPSFVFMENVPAITLGRATGMLLSEFSALGYDCRWTVISAGELGAPHVRERWWLLAHTDSPRLEVSGTVAEKEAQSRRQTGDSSFGMVQSDVWNEAPSVISRMDDGLRPKTHRTKSLGNSVVPLQAREAFRRLMGCDSSKKNLLFPLKSR